MGCATCGTLPPAQPPPLPCSELRDQGGGPHGVVVVVPPGGQPVFDVHRAADHVHELAPRKPAEQALRDGGLLSWDARAPPAPPRDTRDTAQPPSPLIHLMLMKLLLMPLPLPLLLDSPPSTQYRSRLLEERPHGISDPQQIGVEGRHRNSRSATAMATRHADDRGEGTARSLGREATARSLGSDGLMG